MSLTVLSDLRQLHSVIRRHHRVIGDRETSLSPISLNTNSECECPRQPNRCPIHVTCVVVQKVCPANMRMKARIRARIRAGMRAGIMREGMRVGGNEGGSQIKTKSLI